MRLRGRLKSKIQVTAIKKPRGETPALGAQTTRVDVGPLKRWRLRRNRRGAGQLCIRVPFMLLRIKARIHRVDKAGADTDRQRALAPNPATPVRADWNGGGAARCRGPPPRAQQAARVPAPQA